MTSGGTLGRVRAEEIGTRKGDGAGGRGKLYIFATSVVLSCLLHLGRANHEAGPQASPVEPSVTPVLDGEWRSHGKVSGGPRRE